MIASELKMVETYTVSKVYGTVVEENVLGIIVKFYRVETFADYLNKDPSPQLTHRGGYSLAESILKFQKQE